MRNKIWLTIEIIAAIALLILIGVLVKRKIEDKNYLQEQAAMRNALQQEMGITDDNSKEIDAATKSRNAIIEVKKLQEKYKDVVGIIEVPGTKVLYPILQGKDNWYYLDHNKEGNYHVFGEVYLDCRNDSQFKNKNSVIYGHNIRSAKTIFNELLQYTDQEFFDNHRKINVYSLDGFKEYEVISAFHADPEEPYREMNFSNEKEYVEFVKKYHSMSKTEYSIEDSVIENKSLITLSTCFDHNERMVIQALEIKK